MTDSNKVKIMNCPCFSTSEKNLEGQLLYFVENKIPGYSVAINAEKIIKYNEESKLKMVIDESLFPYPDGAGAVLALKLIHNLESEKVNMPVRVLEIANKNKLKVFIVGSKESTHNIAINIIKDRYSNIELVGHLHGYNEPDDIIESIKKSEPQIVMLALGSPRQELFAHNLINSIGFGVAVGCGGALDIIAGELKRAPIFFINNNLEWLYRLIQEPWRWRRQLILPRFALKLLLFKLFKI